MILFFTSPLGLGHVTRDIAIAEKLEPIRNEILFVTGAGAFTLILKKGYSVLDLYKPVNFHTQSGELQKPFRWIIRYLSYYKKCKRIAENVLVKHEGLIISDEDFASIAIGEKLSRKRILITDIMETHFTSGFASIVERRMNKIMRIVIDKCTHVIVPDFGDDKDNFVYVGPIVREVNVDRNTLRKKLGFNKKTVVLSTGGTDAGTYLIEKSLEAYRKLRNKMDIDLVIVPGPQIELASAPDFRNVGFVENLHEYIYASDLVISLAGRSTMDESMAYGVPGIFIPIKNHFEQEDGAKRLGYKYSDIFRIDTLIEEKLDSQRNTIAKANGAEKAAKLILKSL
jgi:UDP-N-acetylglucosamine--N-acetylmuramyl-(pentapeptide) pyrophosphoryl-undecaprenol N-acetylglucosamine transferase